MNHCARPDRFHLYKPLVFVINSLHIYSEMHLQILHQIATRFQRDKV